MSHFAFLFLFLTLFSHAQTPEETLEPIKVTATKNASDFNFSRPESIDVTKIENEPLQMLFPQIAQVPGVISAQNGGPGGQTSFFIRGTESRHVAYTLDGLKLNDPSNTNRLFDSAFFSSPILRDIQVHKGPQAVLFGSDALGGLVEMQTRKGEDAPETRLTLSGGSFGTYGGSLAQDWSGLSSRGTLSYYQMHSDGLSRLNKKRHYATERDSSDITQISSSSKHQFSSRLETDLLFSYLNGKNQLDGNSQDLSNDESRNAQYLLQQKTNYRLSEASSISLRNGLNRHDRIIDTEFFGTNYESVYDGKIIQNELLYRYNHKKFNILAGLATEHEDLQMQDLDESFDLHSLFLQTGINLNKLKFQAGTRVEKHVRYGTFWTGSSGVSYSHKKQTFFLQYSQGFKAPSLYQLYGPSFPGYVVGNEDLVPEVNHAWEGGWRTDSDTYDANITLFQNRLSNQINFIDTLGYFNQDRFIAEGVEVAGKYKWQKLHLNSSYTHQRFRKASMPVVGRPLNSLHAGVAYFPDDNLEVALKGRWFSSRKGYVNMNKTTKLNSYEVFDLGVRYLFPAVEVGVQILNILDREYEDLYGFSTMPRSVFAHTGFRF